VEKYLVALCFTYLEIQFNYIFVFIVVLSFYEN